MRNILIFVESRFKVDRKRIKKTVNDYFENEKIKGDFEVSIAVVGDRRMKTFNKTYRNKDESTTVLSFALENPYQESKNTPDTGFINPPDNVLRLGDIIISYPQAVSRAVEDNMLVDNKIDELVKHGLNCLIGKQKITNY